MNTVSTKHRAVATALTTAILLSGCASSPSGEPISEPSISSSLDQSQTQEGILASIYPGGMPRIVDPSTVTNLSIPDDIDATRAKEAYAWVASYAALSFNDTTFQNLKDVGQRAVFAVSPYFSNNSLPVLIDIFEQYTELNSYDDFQTVSSGINNNGILTIMPKSGTQLTYMNSPIFDRFTFGDASIEAYDPMPDGRPVYKVKFPFSAGLLFKNRGEEKIRDATASRIFEIWVIDTGDVKNPFLIESWTATTLDWAETK